MKIVKSVQSFSSIGYLCSMPYIVQGKKDFWISRSFDPATNSMKIIKESPRKYKGNLAISVFFHFSPDFVPGKLYQGMYIILSDQDGSFDTHIGILYDI